MKSGKGSLQQINQKPDSDYVKMFFYKILHPAKVILLQKYRKFFTLIVLFRDCCKHIDLLFSFDLQMKNLYLFVQFITS